MKRLMVTASLGLMVTMGFDAAEAHPRVYAHSHHKHVVVKQDVVVRPAPVANLVARTIGSAFNTIPANHVRVVHSGRTYYVHDGVYYVREGARYVVVKPVTGIRVTSLPRGYTTVRIGGRTHYRFNGITYRRVNNYYVVV